MTDNALFTIGHSNNSIDQFLDLLRRHQIEVVADVRTTPASRLHPQFNRSALKRSLTAGGIKYVFLGKELGARRAEREAYDGRIASYELIAALPAFKQGLERVRKGANEYRVALMCAEKDPLQCHRTLLVCRHLRDSFSGRIFHILENGTLEPHEVTESRLIQESGLSTVQSEMFSDQTEAPLERAYRRRGLQIAYQENAEYEH